MITLGIIGTAQIVHRFLRGAAHCDELHICGIASREATRAEQFVSAYPTLQVYASYEALFQDPSVYAVYIATPNFTHEELILQALMNGKHVICEKPLCLNEESVQHCFAEAKQRDLILMEAMKQCFLPTTHQVRKWIDAGKIGEVQYIRASNCHDVMKPFLSGWHYDPALGGGVLYDIGVYPIGFVHAMLPQDPREVSAHRRTLDNGCDVFTEISAMYGNTLVHMICGCDMKMKNEAVIYGTKGHILVSDYWKSECADLYTDTTQEHFEEVHEQSEFRYEIQSFCDSIQTKLHEDPIMSEEMSLRHARLIDTIRKE